MQINFIDTDSAYPLFNVTHTSTKPLLVTVELNQAVVDMEEDTGASVSLINMDMYASTKSDILLQTYTDEHLDFVSSVSVDVRYKEHIIHLPLTVVASRGPSLLG